MITNEDVIPMNQTILSFDPYYYFKRKVTTMNTYNTAQQTSDNAELLKMLREKRRERRRRQLSSFYKNMAAQNADKMIFLFDNDMNIA